MPEPMSETFLVCPVCKKEGGWNAMEGQGGVLSCAKHGVISMKYFEAFFIDNLFNIKPNEKLTEAQTRSK